MNVKIVFLKDPEDTSDMLIGVFSDGNEKSALYEISEIIGREIELNELNIIEAELNKSLLA